MKTTEIIAVTSCVISGACLATMQIRRIIRGDLPLFGVETFIAASKINIDKFEKRMLVICGVFFLIFVIFILLN